MEYLNRPVFDFARDWAGKLSRQANYDLRSQQIGFGAPSSEAQQEHVADAYEFGVYLDSPCEINAMERFWQGCYGRLRGFWFAGPERLAQVLGFLSASEVLIVDQGLRDTWTQNPSAHIALLDSTDPAAEIIPAAIQDVSLHEAGIEKITLSAAVTSVAAGLAELTPALQKVSGSNWDVYRLLYGRFANDDLTLQFEAPGTANCTLKVLELPIEYTSVELGNRPVFLYHFWREVDGDRTDWYFTSFDQEVTAGTVLLQHVHTPAPIDHGELTRGITGEREQLQITTWRFAGNPLNAWLPFSPQWDLGVEVSEALLGETTIGPAKLLFAGLVETVKPKGKRLTVTCTTRLDWLASSLPRFKIQRACNNALYGPCCRVDRAAFSVATTVTAIDELGRSMELSAAGIGDKASGWFAFGDARSLDVSGMRELRGIVGSTTGGAGTNKHSIQLTAPFSRKPEIGDQITLAAGCDLARTTCKDKFNNYDNFGGHPFIDQNLALKAIELKTGGGGKGGGGGGK